MAKNWSDDENQTGRDPEEPLKLHLGCGDVHKEGYINIDIRETDATDLTADICKPIPGIKLLTADRIEAYDVLEHLDQNDVLPALRLWVSYLKEGGTIVIRVPELRRILVALGENKIPIQLAQWQIYGGQTNTYDYHKCGFDGSFLEGLLVACGCSKVLQRFDEDDWNVTIVAEK